jgi:hypothetical protein
LHIYNSYIAFFAHIGRTCDNLKHAYIKFRKDDKSGLKVFIKPINSYYSERCVVLHNIKIPFKISKKGMHIPTIQYITKLTQKGNSKFELGWNELLKTNKTEIKKYIKETFYGFTNITNNAFEELCNLAKEIVNEYDMNVNKLSSIDSEGFISGSIDYTNNL